MEKMIENWWHPSMHFFGRDAYMVGDDSKEGYLQGKNESLEARTKREANGAVALAHVNPGSSILDVPCGYGRHSNYLAGLGYDIVGLDINREHLHAARAGGSNAYFLERDMRSIGKDLYNLFDAVFNLTFSFGFFYDEGDNKKTMQEFYSALKPRGKLVLHSDVSPEMILEGNYSLHETRHLQDGALLKIDEEFDEENTRLHGTWTLVRKGSEEQLTPYSVRIYTADELRALAFSAGFRDVQIFGSFKKDHFQATSKEIICVAVK